MVSNRMVQVRSDKREDGLVFRRGDVLFGRLRPYLRKYYLPQRRGICSGEFWVMRADARYLAPAFLYNVVQTDGFIAAANRTSGSRMPRADWGVVRGFRFRLPSLGTQRKIVELLSTWDHAIATLRAHETALRRQKHGLLNGLVAEGKTPGESER